MSLFKNEVPALGDNVTINGSKPVLVERILIPISASTTNQTVFINSTSPYKVIAVRARFGTASTSGTVNVERLTAGQANGAGTAVLATPLSLSGAANTVASAMPVGSVGTINPNECLGIVFAGTLTGLANGILSITVQRA